MQETPKYKFKKPERSDYYNVDDMNDNTDISERELGKSEAHGLDGTLHIGAGTKAAPTDADSVVIVDSAAAGVSKRVAWAGIKAALKLWLDGLFVPTSRKVNGKALNGDITLTAADVGGVPLTQKGAAGGVAPLGADGLVPVQHMPAQVKEMQVTATIATRNAILPRFSGLSVFVKDATGDASVKSGGATYIYDGAAWFKTGEAESMDVVLSWGNVQDKPESFPPSGHVHSAAEIASGIFPIARGGTGAGTAAAARAALGVPALVHSHDDRYYTEAETLSAETKAQLGLGAGATPDEAFNALYEMSFPSLTVFVQSGSVITATCGVKQLSATVNASGSYTFVIPFLGTWTVSAVLSGATSSVASVVVTGTSAYTCTLAYASMTVNTAPSAPNVVITAVSNGVTKTATTNSSGQCVFMPISGGSWNISGSSAGITATDSVIVVAGAIGIGMLSFFNPILANNTWEQIDKASELNAIPPNWKVGDTKNITLTGGEVLTVQVYGFKHDDLQGSEKAGITFGLKNLMATTKRMNSSGTNSGGFIGSELYAWLQDTPYNALPSDLRTVIKSVNKKTSAGSQSTTINTNAMKIFLFSEIECSGTTKFSAAGEGTKYPIFTDDRSRLKSLSNGSGPENIWWVRSPDATASSEFCIVDGNGRASASAAYATDYGICFGFCV